MKRKNPSATQSSPTLKRKNALATPSAPTSHPPKRQRKEVTYSSSDHEPEDNAREGKMMSAAPPKSAPPRKSAPPHKSAPPRKSPFADKLAPPRQLPLPDQSALPGKSSSSEPTADVGRLPMKGRVNKGKKKGMFSVSASIFN